MNVLAPSQLPDWDESLVSRADYSFFGCSAWTNVIEKSYGYKPLYFVLVEGKEQPSVIPCMEINSLLTGRRGVSLAFTDYCEPLVEDNQSFRILFNDIIGYGRKSGWKYVELRGGRRFLQDTPSFATYMVHTLSLSKDEKEMLSRFTGGTRQGINKAIHEGVEVRFATTLHAVKQFYRLHCMTRKRQGVPPQPFSFFRNIYNHVISKDMGYIVLASHKDTIVAGAVYFHLAKTAMYKYGASDKAYQHLRANNLVMWEAIRHYSKSGCTSLCFGRTDADNKGLRRFKSGWGTVEKEICYYRYDIKSDRFITGNADKASRYANLMQKLPIPVLRLIGQVAYRHVG